MIVTEWYKVVSSNLGEVWFQDPVLRDAWLSDNASKAGTCVCYREVRSLSVYKIYGSLGEAFPVGTKDSAYSVQEETRKIGVKGSAKE